MADVRTGKNYLLLLSKEKNDIRFCSIEYAYVNIILHFSFFPFILAVQTTSFLMASF